MTARPFAGLRVAEFGRYVAVPYAAELFAHGGADVIKFEEIEGDETRRNSEIVPGEGRQFIIKARGKRGLAINLADLRGREVALRMLRTCDVVMSNLRPGVLERLGLDYGTVSAEAPTIIYGEIDGFGGPGPDSGRPAIDSVVQAYSGMVVSNRSWDGDRPVLSEAFLNDYMAAMTLAFGVVTALRERDRTGRGQRVRTTLFAAALSLQHGTASLFEAVDGWKRDLAAQEAASGGASPSSLEFRRESIAGNRWFYNTYATSDGFIVVAGPGRLRRPLMDLLGIDDPALTVPGWRMPDDPRLYLEDVYEQAKAAIARWTTDGLVRACAELGIPSAPIRSLESALLSEHAHSSGHVYEADHPVVGPMTLPAAPLWFSELEYRAADRSPAYGQHSVEILRDAGFGDWEIDELVSGNVIGTPDTSPFAPG
jgi:crotonobetainyl-CoA:carnitine CoA-transferase CaiB-like acyl-CoA transferase